MRQGRLNRSGTLTPVPWHVTLLGVVFTICGCSERKAPPPVQPPVPVVIAEVARRSVPIEVRVIGTVEPSSTVTVKSQVSGELTAIYLKEGQYVEKGAPLFAIDSRPLEAELRRAEANLARDMAQGKQAEANLARDLAQLKNAEVEARRYKQLIEKGVVASEQYDRVRTSAEALEAAVRADRAAVENAEEAARADKAAVENVRLQLAYCSIQSPIRGRTGSLMVHRGNVVKANDTPLLVINEVSPIYAAFAVAEGELPAIKKYMSAGQLEVDALIPNDEERPERGVLTFMDNAVDRSTGTIRLKATFENRERRLWPGQFVNVVVTLTAQPNALVVPAQAVQTGQAGAYVFVVKPDMKAEPRPVVVGRTLRGEAVIDKGLEPGEKVVTDGQLRLVPGSRVEIKGALEGPQETR